MLFRGRLRFASPALMCGLALALLGTESAPATPSAPACSGGLCTVTFAYSGAPDAWVVPTGVSAAKIELDGGAGASASGSGAPAAGGLGARVTATLGNLTPGATLAVTVGGAGTTDGTGAFGGGAAGGPGAGGGGGASALSLGNAVQLIAGGGGGGGATGSSPTGSAAGGTGGSGGLANNAGAAGAPTALDGATLGGGSGGTGGGGSPGTASGADSCGGTSVNGQFGGSGTTSTGGAGGTYATAGATAGGGGGGGGARGGGGGGTGALDTDRCSGTALAGSGGGGGGSSFAIASASAVSIADGVRAGNGTVTITYAAPLIAAPHSYTVNQDATLTAAAPALQSGASAAGGVTLTAAAASQPGHGTLSVGADGSFTYTPAIGFVGTDSFSYTLTDGPTTSAPAQVTVTVVGAPIASIDAPADGQTFNLGDTVATAFHCADAAGGPGIATCVDSGAAASGAGTLDTSQLGTFSYSVTATSADGQSATTSISYTVAPAPIVLTALPVNLTLPALSGSATTGATLSCSTGSWSGAPTGYVYSWTRNGTSIKDATQATYTVQAIDAGSAINCVVNAVNAGGFTSASPGTPLQVSVHKVASCPAASGAFTATGLGSLRLGDTRTQAASAFPGSSLTHTSPYEDSYCLTPAGVAVGYLTPALAGLISKRAQRQLSGRVVWISTTSPAYAIGGIRPGADVSSLWANIALSPVLTIGSTDWYIARVNNVSALFKTEDGTVEAVGYANPKFTAGPARQQVLLAAFQ